MNRPEKIIAKKIITRDLNGNENGYLVELGKNDRFTTSYLTVCAPKCCKGPHLHKIRDSNYVCIKGTIKIILYLKHVGRKEYILNPTDGLHIPINIPVMIKNESSEEAWLINTPFPAYDPLLKDEQVDYTEEECERLFNNK